MMKTDHRTIALAACAAVIVAAPIAYAQVATTLEQAELAGLTSAGRISAQGGKSRRVAGQGRVLLAGFKDELSRA